MANKKHKQSLLSGVLAGSLGIFISKALGLFYVVPLNSLAGGSNMFYYSVTYSYYDLLLKVCSAGIPFAIAALVAKYVDREDYKSAILIKKLGTSFIMALSFTVTILFMLMSKNIASHVLGPTASIEDIKQLIALFRILLLALVFVPLLSSIRGYYQGLKRMDIYATSQVLEQFIRVFSIVFLGFLAVKVFNFDGIYAIYMAILAAGISAILTILYFVLASKDENLEIEKKIAEQESEAIAKDVAMKEIISLGVPYVVISFLGTCSPLIDSNFFISYATRIGMDYEQAKLALGVVQTNCNKIASIPQVLTLGFSAGLVPYLTESYERRDNIALSNQLKDIFAMVVFILLPVASAIFFFAKPIYAIMYGTSQLDTTSPLLATYALVAFTDTIAPIFSSVLITLRSRKKAIVFLIITLIIKYLTFFMLVPIFNAYGMILSTACASFAMIIFGSIFLNHNYGFSLLRLANISIRTLITTLISMLPFVLINTFISMPYSGRLVVMMWFMVETMLMILIYVVVACLIHLPQDVFHIEKLSLRSILKYFKH